MLIIRFIVNLVILALELAAVAGVAWLGWRYPMALAALAAVLALGMGLALEQARLKNEIGFYFGRAATALSWAGASLAGRRLHGFQGPDGHQGDGRLVRAGIVRRG